MTCAHDAFVMLVFRVYLKIGKKLKINKNKNRQSAMRIASIF